MLRRNRGDLEHLTRGILQRKSDRLQQVRLLLERGLESIFTKQKDHLTLLETRAELVNPDNILKRGFSMTLLDGKSIRKVQDVKSGDLLETRLYDGTIISKAEKSLKRDDKGED